MATAGNINIIGEQYRRWMPNNAFGAPEKGNEKPSAVMPVDRVSLSAQALQDKADHQGREDAIKRDQDLSPEEKQQIEQLKRRDAEVKAHEQAHMAAGGGIVQGGASYQYETGPDGKSYAVGGEVKIDTSSERTPQATIRKMQQVRRAALAPAQPSATDRAVAARATQIEAQARSEKTSRDQSVDENRDPNAPAHALDNLSGFQSPGANMGQQIDLTI